ncbi:MAG: addiction module protein [Leptospirales bacterium]
MWDTISDKTENVELSEQEKKIIDERLEAFHQNPELGSPWADVYQRITGTK